ncbi:MAG: hypothetical protein E7560_06505 [Ruminococcaceae bacterium]|nr:hypothetical protein [Oscillospiraceae bacterium]
MAENKQFLTLKSVTLAEIVREIVKKWYIILSMVLVSVTITAIYTFLFVTPEYVSSAKLYVTKKETNDMSSSDFSISTLLVNDFSNIIKDRVVIEQVADALEDKYSYGYIRNSVSINNPESTRIIEIAVSTPSAKDSKLIADTICDISVEKITELIDLDRIKIIRKGTLPSSPSTPNVGKNLILAFLIGLSVSFCVVCLNYALNNKIASSSDVEKYLNLPVLGTVPYAGDGLPKRR